MPNVFDFNPTSINPFPYWKWNKVLPAVYDDSLSQYEILCKLLHVVNTIIDSTNSTGEQVEQLTQLVQQLIDGQFPSGIVQYVQDIITAIVGDDISAINAAIEAIQAQIDGSSSSIMYRLNALETIGKPTLYSPFINYYVSVDGSDDNAGTRANPFRQPTKAIQTAQKNGYAAFRIIFLTSGSYELNGGINIMNCGIHFLNDNDNVDISLYLRGSELSFYNCHLNFRGSASNYFKIYNNTSYASGYWWCDNCKISFTYTELIGKVGFFGSHIQCATNIRLQAVLMYSSQMFISHGMQCTNTSYDTVFEVYNSQLSINGGSSHADTLVENFTSGAFIYCMDSVVIITAVLIPSALTNKYNKFIDAYACFLICNQWRYDDPRTNGCTNDSTMQNGTLRVKTNTFVEV